MNQSDSQMDEFIEKYLATTKEELTKDILNGSFVIDDNGIKAFIIYRYIKKKVNKPWLHMESDWKISLLVRYYLSEYQEIFEEIFDEN